MEILYSDRHIVCAVKEPGVASQPDPSGRDDMVSLLGAEFGCEIYAVHRLDTPTGGAMVYAKSSAAAGGASAALAEGTKQYNALVHGHPGEGVMEDWLYHDRRINKSFTAKKERKGVKRALLEYETVKELEDRALVKVTLHTGRTHQIRVQFSSRGYPLVGDGKYGSRDRESLRLWCTRLSFVHPITKKTMVIESPAPEGFFGI